MEILNIMPGVKVCQSERGSALLGCPPEVIKFLMQRDIPFPEMIVLPDKISHKGTLQNATEFPLYYFLFVLGNFFKGKKLTIVGDKQAIENNRALLKLTLLGPSKEQYAEIGSSPYFDSLYNESRAISVKDKAGKEVPIDDFINFIAFDGDVAEHGGLRVAHKGFNVFEVNGEEIDINFDEEQRPPYDLKRDYVPMIPAKFGVDVLGGASGFVANKPCSGLVINYFTDFMLVDCVPYLEHSLSCRGIAKQQVKSIYLTHIHDDHCNIFPLVHFDNKIKLLGTKEVYWMAMKKLSLMTDQPMEEFYSYFEFVEMEPYKENEFYGLSIVPHYTVHSIPTIGATFKMRDGKAEHSLVFVGDNKSLPDIKGMADSGVVSEEKFENIKRLYHDHHDLLFADGGGGILHGDPKDSLDSTSDRVIFLHLESLPKEFDATFSLAEDGKRYTIVESADDAYIIKSMEIFYDSFPGISNDWMTTLMNNLKIEKHNAGDVIMKQGEKSKGIIYIILSGTCNVMRHDGEGLQALATKQAGEFIGEMAIVKKTEHRSASIVANTPLALCAIEEDLFYSFLSSENRINPTKRVRQTRSELEFNREFNRFTNSVNEALARAGKKTELKKGTSLDNLNSFYIVLDGALAVEKGGKKLETLEEGAVLGNYPGLLARVEGCKITASTDASLLELSKTSIANIAEATPALHYYIMQWVHARTRVY